MSENSDSLFDIGQGLLEDNLLEIRLVRHTHDGRGPLDLVDDLRTAGLFTAGFVRHECKEGVVRKPDPNEPAHGNVMGGGRGRAAEKISPPPCVAATTLRQ